MVVGVAIALLGALIALVYDLARRFDDRLEADDHRSALLAALDGTPWLLEAMRDISTNAKIALEDDQNSELFSELIRAEIGQTGLFMHDLTRGRVRVPVGEVTPMANQIDQVDKTVRATTIPEIDVEWWELPAGKDYLQRNKRAAERGVAIQRVVLWTEGDDSPKLAKVIREQLEAKVEVLFAKRTEVPDELKTNMAIYDELSYNDVVFNSDGDGIYVEYYLEPTDAQRAVARFEKLRAKAKHEVPSELPLVAEAVEELRSSEDKRKPRRLRRSFRHRGT